MTFSRHRARSPARVDALKVEGLARGYRLRIFHPTAPSLSDAIAGVPRERRRF